MTASSPAPVPGPGPGPGSGPGTRRTGVPIPVRLLLIEDSEADAMLILRTLRKSGFVVDVRRVDHQAALLDALAEGGWDVVISDYNMPNFRCELGLEIVSAGHPDLPFLVVSGAVGEEKAADLMRSGASDFVSKDNPARLGPAVSRELRDAAERRARRQADSDLKESEERYRLLAENVADLIWTFDHDQCVSYANPSMLRLFGYPTEEMEGRPFADLITPAAYRKVGPVFQAATAAPELLRGRRFELEHVRKDGSTFWTEAILSPLPGPDGRLRAFLGVARDITDRRVTEQRLRDSEAKLQEAHRLGQLGHWDVDIDSGRLYFAEHLYGLFGLVRDPGGEGLSVSDFLACVDPDDLPGLWKMGGMVLATGQAGEFEHRIVRPLDGAVRWVRHVWQARTAYPGPVGPDDGPAAGAGAGSGPGAALASALAGARATRRVFGLTQDVTERKLYELEIEQSEKKLRTIFDNAVDGIIMTNERGVIETFNPAAEQIFGYRSKEMVGRHVNVLIPNRFHRTHDVRMDEFAKAWYSARQMGNWRRVDGVRKDGSEFPVMASIAKASVGNSRLMTVILRDMTETAVRENALRVSREEAIAASKAKTRFLATMSHELRTPLNAILGFSEIIRDELFGPVGVEKYIKYASDIYDSGRHLLALISDILDISKIEVGKVDIQPRLIDLRGMIISCVRLMEGQAREHGVDIITELPDAPPPLYADERAAKQIVFNLLSNAVKFTPAGGKVHVRASATTDGGLDLAISDSGIGIPHHQLDRLMRPFERMTDAYSRTQEGAGLGLAIVKGLVDHHGGHIKITSVVGKGTVVAIHFPARVDSRLDAPPVIRSDGTT